MKRFALFTVVAAASSAVFFLPGGATLVAASLPAEKTVIVEDYTGQGYVSCRVKLEAGGICFEHSTRTAEDALLQKAACEQHGTTARFLARPCDSEHYLASCRRVLRDSLGALLFESRVVHAGDKWHAPSDWNDRLSYHQANCEATGGVWETSLEEVH